MRIELKWLSDLIQPIIHSNSSENNIEDYILPGISELKPGRVSWSANIIGIVAGERKLKLSFPGNDIDLALMIEKVWAHFLVVIIYLASLLETEPLGDSTS